MKSILRHPRLLLLALLLIGWLLGVVRFGERNIREYEIIKRQFEAEQEYVDRVKKEAEQR